MRSKTSTVLVALAVMSLWLVFLASTMAYAQVPAGRNRPAGVPDGYVITPFGYFHPSCVRQMAEGETLLSRRSIPSNARTELWRTFLACAYPALHGSRRGPVGGRAQALSPYLSPTAGLKMLVSPRIPRTARFLLSGPCRQRRLPKRGQVVYFSPGLEDVNGLDKHPSTRAGGGMPRFFNKSVGHC